MRIRLPSIDQFSFWIGFVLSALIWWFFSLARPAFRHISENSRKRRDERKERSKSTSAIETRYRQVVLAQAQGMHLAAPLFALDEIIQQPRLLTPPPRIEPGMQVTNEDIVQNALPYLPAWPELAAAYKAPTLSIFEALSGDSDIVLIGHTGMGKTVALAYLASRIARKNPEPCIHRDYIPFLMHVADIDTPINTDNPLNSLINFIADKVPILDLPRIPEFIKKAFTDGRALLLLDGTDELTPEGLKNIIEFIKAVKNIYPQTTMVTTASPEFLDGLVSLNFIPFAIAAWNDAQKQEYLQNWAAKWNHFVAKETWAQNEEHVDSLLMNGWLASESSLLTPLEFTLKTWGAYAGDLRGDKAIDAIESHLLRMVPGNIPFEALESLAIQINISSVPIFDPHRAREWVRSFEPAEAAPDGTDNAGDTSGEKRKKPKQEKLQSPSPGLISLLVNSGLLSQHRNSRTRFSHPIYGGYLAGKGLVNYKPDAVLDQPPWIGKYLAMQYLAIFGDISVLAEKLGSIPDRPLFQNLLTIARWLKEAPPQAAWRTKVMAKLLELLQTEGQPLGLRAQVIAAFCQQANDPSIVLLFRKMLEDNPPDLQQMVALGTGALRDAKSVPLLAKLTGNPNTNVRQAACLALAAIGTEEAMNALADALLQGDENQRRTAAEAMANNPAQGYEFLREAASLQTDLMVRRAATYGLARINEPWANEILQKLQTDDDQWVVRTAANEVLEDKSRPNPSIPKRLPPPTESPWIIAFAGKMGIGVTPDKPPIDLLLAALKSETHEERLASLQYLRSMPTEGVFSALFQAMYHGDRDLREAVYYTLSEIAARGVKIPDPEQFGPI